MNNVYRHTDKRMPGLDRFIESEFQNLASVLPFDELNIPKIRKAVQEMFERIDWKTRDAFGQICKLAYADGLREVPEHDDVVDILLAFADEYLSEYNGVTGYVYDREWKRKCDRTVEALISVMSGMDRNLTNSQRVRKVLQQQAKQIEKQVHEYGDLETDAARVQAFENCGVRKVQWVTMKDGKVCEDCHELDGMVFDIGHVPDKHWNCRCTLIPVKDH